MKLMTAMIKSSAPKPNPSFIFRLILFTSSLPAEFTAPDLPRPAVMARTLAIARPAARTKELSAPMLKALACQRMLDGGILAVIDSEGDDQPRSDYRTISV